MDICLTHTFIPLLLVQIITVSSFDVYLCPIFLFGTQWLNLNLSNHTWVIYTHLFLVYLYTQSYTHTYTHAYIHTCVYISVYTRDRDRWLFWTPFSVGSSLLFWIMSPEPIIYCNRRFSLVQLRFLPRPFNILPELYRAKILPPPHTSFLPSFRIFPCPWVHFPEGDQLISC